MFSKTKFPNVFTYLLVSLTLFTYSCQEDKVDPIRTVNQQSIDLKSQLNQDLPEAVKSQLELSSKNLAIYMQDELQMVNIHVVGSISEKGAGTSHRVVADKESMIAFGNIMDPSSVKVGKMQDLYSSKELANTQSSMEDFASQEIKPGDNLLEITWKSGNEIFKTNCFYRESGIIWDNVLTGLIMMDPQGVIEETTGDKTNTSNQRAVSSSWYKQWWTAKWLWGSERGEMGYKITIYYSGSRVSNTDVSDWGRISLGKARSESKIVKNSGSYGKCRYALGMCTPTGSLSFNASNFSVSFSGLGSNIVANGYKSRYP